MMNLNLTDLTERLVPISDFSQGKAGKIFNDVSINDHEYIILKNNQPTAVLLSIKEYKIIKDKISKLEKFLEEVENLQLLKVAESRSTYNTSSFETLISDEGFSIEEIRKLAESVELE